MGDSTKITDSLSVLDADLADKQERALACLRAGGKLNEAAKAAGVIEKTLYNWRAEDPEFRRAVSIARAVGKSLRVMVARDKVFEAAKKGSLTACFYIIEHDDPEATPSVNVNIGGQPDNPLVSMTVEELRAERERIRLARTGD